jgi:hypothetical protein
MKLEIEFRVNSRFPPATSEKRKKGGLIHVSGKTIWGKILHLGKEVQSIQQRETCSAKLEQ